MKKTLLIALLILVLLPNIALASDSVFTKSCVYDWNSTNHIGEEVLIRVSINDSSGSTVYDSVKVNVIEQVSVIGVDSNSQSNEYLNIHINTPLNNSEVIADIVSVFAVAKGPNELGSMLISFSGSGSNIGWGYGTTISDSDCTIITEPIIPIPTISSGGGSGGNYTLPSPVPPSSGSGGGGGGTPINTSTGGSGGGIAVPVNETEDLETECIDSCHYEDSCLSHGIRIIDDQTPSYCSITDEWETQKGVEQDCQNNYECTSNFCSNGKCLDIGQEIKETKNILEQIIDFLKSIFGFSDK